MRGRFGRAGAINIDAFYFCASRLSAVYSGALITFTGQPRARRLHDRRRWATMLSKQADFRRQFSERPIETKAGSASDDAAPRRRIGARACAPPPHG